MDPIETWLADNPDPSANPFSGMADAGLLEPAPDYATIARGKAAIVERTGLLGLAGVWSGPQLVFRHFLSFGTEAQRQAWRGRALAVAISEPGVGAHPGKLTTRAEAVAGGFRLTGRKAWVSNASLADAVVVFAVAAETAGRKRYAAFLVPRDTPGLQLAEMPAFHALRPARHWLLTLDCVVPATAALGPDGSAYEPMAKPFRDIEDAVGSFAVAGAIRHAMRRRGNAEPAANDDRMGEVAALHAVFAAAAEAAVAAVDAGCLPTATLAGLWLLGRDLLSRLQAILPAETAILEDLDAVLSIAHGPRRARLSRLATGPA